MEILISYYLDYFTYFSPPRSHNNSSLLLSTETNKSIQHGNNEVLLKLSQSNYCNKVQDDDSENIAKVNYFIVQSFLDSGRMLSKFSLIN